MTLCNNTNYGEVPQKMMSIIYQHNGAVVLVQMFSNVNTGINHISQGIFRDADDSGHRCEPRDCLHRLKTGSTVYISSTQLTFHPRETFFI